MKEFTYLVSIIARDGHIEAELQKRMSKASMSFGRLRERLWNNHNVSIRVKGKIFRAIILSTLLYGAETWTVYRRHVMRHLRSIMKIRWQDKVTNIKVLKRAGFPTMEDLLIRPRGRPRLRCKDTIKRNLKKRDIDINSWKFLALQRDIWRDTVK